MSGGQTPSSCPVGPERLLATERGLAEERLSRAGHPEARERDGETLRPEDGSGRPGGAAVRAGAGVLGLLTGICVE